MSITIPNLNDLSFAPGLYLVATPIGNLADITLRALAVLQAADLVLCEDTRVTGILLKHYGITTSRHIYNDQSEQKDQQAVIDRIKAGRVVALVSDAGMPMISDPGYQLVQKCRGAGVLVTSCPGASSVMMALQLSGLANDAFFFAGFLPVKAAARQQRLKELHELRATLIFFERASRVPDVLVDIAAIYGDRQVVIARELTKKFEEIRRGLPDQLSLGLVKSPIKGEVVLLVDRSAGQGIDDETLVKMLRAEMASLPLRQAVDRTAEISGAPRRHVYQLALALKHEQ